MSALEDRILQEIRKLDESQQQQLLRIIEDMQPRVFDFDAWMQDVEAFQARLKTKYGEQHYFGVQDLLDELREEASWPRW